MRSLRLAREKYLQLREEDPLKAKRSHMKYRSFRENSQGSELVDSNALENIKAQREAFDLAAEVAAQLFYVALTSRGKDITEIKELLKHTDDLIQISHEIQNWLHNLFDSASGTLSAEYYWEAVKALEPLLAKHPGLTHALSDLEPLCGEDTVRKFRHSPCGGYFHTIGRSKENCAKFYHLCDRCGHGYWTWSQ